MSGRGAWPKNGRGGTLNSRGDGPGPYYRTATNGYHPGLRAWCLRERGEPVPRDYLAVFHGVLAIQLLVGAKPDGFYGPGTEAAVRKFQQGAGLAVDGIVGHKTMPRLLESVIARNVGHESRLDAVWGILHWEGGWDPGAVGGLDANDLGLAQINTIAHPETSFTQAFCASYAIGFIDDYLYVALAHLGNNLRDAVASYNLGIGGARQWIAAGRPDTWTPKGSTSARQPNTYVDRILSARSQFS